MKSRSARPLHSVCMQPLSCVLFVAFAAAANAQSQLTGVFREKLFASDAQNHDQLGSSVAMVGNTVFVGAPEEDFAGIDSGAVYVYTRSGSTWTQVQKLAASDGVSYTEFGTSVAVQGDLLVVGAKGGDGVVLGTGAAYAFRLVAGVWTEESKFFANDGANGDWFGRSIALSNDTAVVGTFYTDAPLTDSGAVYVFVRNGTTWAQEARIVPADSTVNAYAGISVAVEGDTLVFGAFGPPMQGQAAYAGTAYVYTRTNGTWSLAQKLGPPVADEGDRFGWSLCLQGPQLMIGAVNEGLGLSYLQYGAAYVFTRNGSSWTQTAHLLQSDPVAYNNFGSSVAIDGNVAVVGAMRSDEYHAGGGALYLFQRFGNVWVQRPKMTPSDGYMRGLGASVVLQSNRIVSGCPEESAPGASIEGGSAWYYELTPYVDYICPGDDTGTACPCANPSPLGQSRGCRNTVTPGSRLRLEGVPSVAANSVDLLGLDMPNASALLFQGSTQINLGAGVVFGDGLRCVGGSIRRLGTVQVAFESCSFPDALDLTPISVRGGVSAGDLRTYQLWYRNAVATFCTSATFNLTNGLQILWQP